MIDSHNSIEWRDITLKTIPRNGESSRIILNRVSGSSQSELTAIIGPSGCGKVLYCAQIFFLLLNIEYITSCS
jgi:filamentous hemagglutinin family protein